jgi:hypothetical protein
MKKTIIFQLCLLFLFSFSFSGCKKKNTKNSSGTATLKLTINGQQESFDFGYQESTTYIEPDCQLNTSDCIELSGPGALVESIYVSGENGNLSFFAGQGITITNETYSYVADPSNSVEGFCNVNHFDIYAMGDLESRLQDIYNVPISRLVPANNGTISFSGLGSGKVNINWTGTLNVLDFNGSILGTFSAVFTAQNVPYYDFR